MKTVRKYWPFMSAGLTLLGILVAIGIFLIDRPTKALHVIVHVPVSLVDIRPEAATDIEVLYKGRPVGNIILLQVDIKNAGNQPITENDYSRPLTFSFGPTSHLADVSVTASHPPNVGLDIRQTGEYQAEADPTLLNPDDLVSVRFIVIGASTQSVLAHFQIDGRIVGVKEIGVVSASEQPVSRLSPETAAIATAVLTMVLNLVLLASRDRLSTLPARLARGISPEPDSVQDLVIHAATYGTQAKSIDVTDILKPKVKDGKLEFVVANDNLGGDPAYGEKKTLNVTYTYSGEQHSVTADEWETLSLP